MHNDKKVRELLDSNFDSDSTPEEVCRECPELLTVVRDRWQQMCQVEAELQRVFSTCENHSADEPTQPPCIPGHDVEFVLGRGGMGIVYKARDTRLRRDVAIKTLLIDGVTNRDDRTRFLREAEAAASLRHENIVQVYASGEHEGRPYFVMEYMKAGSLSKRLAGTPIPAFEAAALIERLARAIAAAHEQGIVHRDLKPANILLDVNGTPKIADFGLACRPQDEAGITTFGARIGTPSYMAPEQALGTAGFGPTTDIYALGAVLYESLTGRPPFRAETSLETQRQVVSEEPVPPSRLNTKVPRDIETICLKCLDKSPAARYSTALELADDLRRFQLGEPIAARRASAWERSAKWIRRNPSLSATLAASFLLLIGLITIGFSASIENIHRHNAVERDLSQVATFQNEADWTLARAALDRAGARYDGRPPYDVQERLRVASRDLEFVMRLDDIRLRRLTNGNLDVYKSKANSAYAHAFEHAGLGTLGDDPQRFAANITASPIRAALITALYDWALCAAKERDQAWLLQVTAVAEKDRDPWLEKALEESTWNSSTALSKVADDAAFSKEPSSKLLLIGERLRTLGADSVPYLRKVQQAHPSDFWANLVLGDALVKWAPAEAIGFYRAALASRPRAAICYCAVGDALHGQHDLKAAQHYYQTALEVDASYARTCNNLGLTLQEQQQFEKAVAYHKQALSLDPEYAWAHLDLGHAYQAMCQFARAENEFKQILDLAPYRNVAVDALKTVLLEQARPAEALTVWQRSFDFTSRSYDDWAGYPELCLLVGNDVEYQKARDALLRQFRSTTDLGIAAQVARVSLLKPDSTEAQQAGIDLINTALKREESLPEGRRRYLQFAKGFGEYRQGHFNKAISLMRGGAATVLGPAPELIAAMAEHDSGQIELSRKTFTAAVVNFDWDLSQADHRDIWTAHIILREAEAKLWPHLQDYLRGEDLPSDLGEELAYLPATEYSHHSRATAQLYDRAFKRDSMLDEKLENAWRNRSRLTNPKGRIAELATMLRYPAARAAALAAASSGTGSETLSAQARAAWRKKSRDWIRMDLKVLKGSVAKNAETSTFVENRLSHLRFDPSFAGVRDRAYLRDLATTEQEDSSKLWAEVDAVIELARRAKQ